MRDYWFLCHNCGYEWIAPMVSQFGCLFAVSSHGEECPECDSNDIEATDEYRPPFAS